MEVIMRHAAFKSLILIVMIIVALMTFQGCATLQTWLGSPQLETYTFNYNGEDYSALLPKEVPMPPETAVPMLQSYWGIVYAMHVKYVAGKQPEPDLPVASFWFTPELGVVGLAWHTLEDGSVKHEGWLYVKGLPVGTTVELFQEMLDALFTKLETPGV